MKLVIISLSVSAFSILVGFLYSYVVLYTDWFRRWSIQGKVHKAGHFMKRFPLIGLNIVLLFVLSGVGIYFGQSLFVIETPTIGVFVFQFLVLMFVDDLYFYGYHRLMHEREYLYRTIHRIHHRATTPFPLEFIYVHPLEWMIGAAGIFLGVVLLGEVNAYAFWVYVFFRNMHEVDIHSGVRSLWAHYIPLYGTVEHHDLHHSKITGNYASTFTLWDKLFRTEVKE